MRRPWPDPGGGIEADARLVATQQDGLDAPAAEEGQLVGGDQGDLGARCHLLGVEGGCGFLPGEVIVDQLPAAVAAQGGPPLSGVFEGLLSIRSAASRSSSCPDGGQSLADGARTFGRVRHSRRAH